MPGSGATPDGRWLVQDPAFIEADFALRAAVRVAHVCAWPTFLLFRVRGREVFLTFERGDPFR